MTIATIDQQGAGIATSALAAGGNNPTGSYVNAVESWNGTNWINEQTLSVGRSLIAAGGASGTSSIVFGGYNPAGAQSNSTEEWYGDGKLTETFTTS